MTDGGLLCPKCNSGTSVYDSRPKPGGTKRRYRECRHCGFRFKTIETAEADEIKPKKIKAEDYRAKDMINLRQSGMTYEEIGKRFGVSKQRVHQILKEDRLTMPDKKPTDNEIIKALECMNGKYNEEIIDCRGCAFEGKGLCRENCSEGLAQDSLDLINRSEAVKEFAEKLKEKAFPDDSICTQMVVLVEDIDDLVKETVGDE